MTTTRHPGKTFQATSIDRVTATHDNGDRVSIHVINDQIAEKWDETKHKGIVPDNRPASRAHATMTPAMARDFAALLVTLADEADAANTAASEARAASATPAAE